MKHLLATLLVVGLLLAYWQLFLAAAVIVAIVKAAPIAWRELQSERADRKRDAEQTAWRADAEDAMYVRGDDERGVYGRWDGVRL